MKPWIGVLATASLLCAPPVLAQDRQVAPADMADLQCMALAAFMAGLALQNEEEAAPEMAGLAGGMMYYLGRLEGRSPDIDWLNELSDYLVKLEPSDL